MDRYTALSRALDVLETIGRVYKDEPDITRGNNEVIEHIRDLMKDVRYGGRWDGDFETIAEDLERCASGDSCAMCSYRHERDGGRCIRMLKKDAAAAIRQGSALTKLAEAKAQSREPAAWQKEDMARGNVPEKRLELG